MKKVYKYLAVAAAVVIIIVLALVSRPKEVGTLKSPLAVTGDAQAGSFIVSNYPSIKPEDKIFGSAEAALKIFVYEDYTSSYSAKLADTLDKVKADNGDKVAIVIRPFFKNSPLAGQAQTAVDCAGEQKKWMEMRALLLAQAKIKQLSAANFSAYGEQIGLNAGDFGNCLTKNEKSVKIEQLVQEAESYSVQGAPTMFIGEEVILGARPYDDFIDSNGDRIEGLNAVVSRMMK